MTRAEARRRIVKKAEEIRLAGGVNVTPRRGRHLHYCVFIVRQHAAVGPELLEDAGFRS